MFSEFQIKKYVDLRRQLSQTLTMHLDACPHAVVKLPNTNQDKPTYYSLLCSSLTPQISNMPIADFLTTDTSTASLTNFLLTFKRSVAKLTGTDGGGGLMPDFIVMDYSPNAISTVLLALNGENPLQYVNKMYVITVLQQAYYNTKPFTYALVCQTAFLDIFARSLRSRVKDKILRKFTCNCMRLLINSPVIEDVKYFYQAVYYMLCMNMKDGRYSYYNELLTNNFSMTTAVADDEAAEKEETGLSAEFFDDDMWAEGFGSLRDESKFTKLFSDFLTSVPVIDTGMFFEKNPYYCPAAFKAIEFHMHLFPLFSRIVPRNGLDVKRTNAPLVEWFTHVKNTLLQKKLFRRPYEFIKIVNQHVSAKFKESIIASQGS
jgi:hypothetical protein